MTIEIDERTRAMWSVEMRGGAGNFLAHLGRQPDGQLRFDMRFRWYADGEIDLAKSEDRTSWHALELRTERDEARAIAKFREVIEHMRKTTGNGESWELLRGARSLEEFLELLRTMPGMHMGEPISEEEWDRRIRAGMRHNADATS